jgi:hypothetical protein
VLKVRPSWMKLPEPLTGSPGLAAAPFFEGEGALTLRLDGKLPRYHMRNFSAMLMPTWRPCCEAT